MVGCQNYHTSKSVYNVVWQVPMKARYNSINDYLKGRFGERVYKVTLESGCGCPNRDGTLGTDGCIYCNEGAYNPATHANGMLSSMSIREQLIGGIEYVNKRHQAAKFVAYFQRGSNTYGPLQKLVSIYNDAIDHPDVVGLAISTRPDCFSPAMMDALEELSSKTMLWIELGLQSARTETLNLIRRGHTVDQFISTHRALKERGIPVCAHVILGLPGETGDDMLSTARLLNEEKVWGVKIHNLHVLKDTELERLYNEGNITLPSLEEYAHTVVDFLEHLSPEILIHRVNSHSPRSITVAPEWSINKLAIFNAVEAQLEKLNSYQGKSL